MSPTFKRTERVSSTLSRDIARIILTHVKDPRLAHVTITAAHVSPDLSVARVYFVVTMEPSAKPEKIWQAAQKGLESASGFIRRELGKVLELRRVPELTFIRDESLQNAGRIESLLREIEGKSE